MIVHVILLSLAIVNSYCDSLGVFDDSVLFDISWPGLLPEAQTINVESNDKQSIETEVAETTGGDSDPVLITTLKNEKYHCVYAPDQTEKSSDEDSMTSDADAVVLLTPLFTKKQCLYRVESYWSYELCIGRHLRQFHEEKGAGQSFKLTEYYLGQSGLLHKTLDTHLLDTDEHISVEDATHKEETEGEQRKQSVPTWNYDGMEYPYYEVEMTGGTLCDLRNDEPRSTRLLFICLEDVFAEFVYVKEITTCKYEVVVATSLLCHNKAYKVQQEQAHSIKCYALDGSPSQPASLVSHRKTLESTALDEHTQQEQNEPSGKESDASNKLLFQSLNIPQGPMESDPQLIQQILLGEYCIPGGTGWWKHELCYQRYVQQYHRDAKGKTEIVLGKWDKERHVKWLAENSKTLTKTQVVHYYAGGDVCDITKQPRECQVRIRCVKSMVPTQISIYIQEPSPCKYILTVETSFLCPLIENADEHGMLRS